MLNSRRRPDQERFLATLVENLQEQVPVILEHLPPTRLDKLVAMVDRMTGRVLLQNPGDVRYYAGDDGEPFAIEDRPVGGGRREMIAYRRGQWVHREFIEEDPRGVAV